MRGPAVFKSTAGGLDFDCTMGEMHISPSVAGESSNGRTKGSGPVSEGSNPSSPASSSDILNLVTFMSLAFLRGLPALAAPGSPAPFCCLRGSGSPLLDCCLLFTGSPFSNCYLSPPSSPISTRKSAKFIIILTWGSLNLSTLSISSAMDSLISSPPGRGVR